MRRLYRLLLPIGALAMLAFPATAAAVPLDPLPHHGGGDAQARALPHPGVEHSPNMNLLFNSQNPDNATNSDLAFWGNRAYQGDYFGLRIFDISNPAAPQLLSRFACRGPQNDPIVWQNRLVFLAVDAVMSGPECGALPAQDPTAAGGWEGVRIIDVSDPANPRQVHAVYTDCGAHTITLWPRDRNTVLIYVSSYSLRPGPTCGPVQGPAAGRDPLHGVIQVIEVPVNDPTAAREIAEPPINYPGDPDNKFDPAEHGLAPGFDPLRACHDIAVYVELRLAAGACAEQSQLWRVGANGIPDTANPIWVFDDPRDTDGPGGGDVAVDFWHSATFSWDGKIVNLIDESFGSGCPPVTQITEPGAAGPSDTGRMFFLRTATGRLLSHFMIPRPESLVATNPRTGRPTETAYCSAHLGNVATSIGRYFLVNAWYLGGADVVDFTNVRAPFELAFWDFNAATTAWPGLQTGSDNWSHYWYENMTGDNNGLWTFGTDGVHNPTTGRGFEVFRVTNRTPDVGLRRLNPQTQENVITCRIATSPRTLRARERSTLTIRARAAGGAQILPERLARTRVTLRGPGIRVNTTTNGRGVARVRGITPARKGVLRVRVPGAPNLVGCQKRLGVLAVKPVVRVTGQT